MLGGLTAALCALIAYDVRKPAVLRVVLCLGAWVGFVSDFV